MFRAFWSFADHLQQEKSSLGDETPPVDGAIGLPQFAHLVSLFQLFTSRNCDLYPKIIKGIPSLKKHLV